MGKKIQLQEKQCKKEDKGFSKIVKRRKTRKIKIIRPKIQKNSQKMFIKLFNVENGTKIHNSKKRKIGTDKFKNI